MNISIKTIPHADQRYRTVGDWWFEEQSVLQIRVSELGDTKWENLIAMHELTEALLCFYRDIYEKDVTAFDQTFEAMRAQFPEIVKDDEPGDNEHAPYRKEHFTANLFEERLAEELSVNWTDYEKAIKDL